jgi:hypothetical protein
MSDNDDLIGEDGEFEKTMGKHITEFNKRTGNVEVLSIEEYEKFLTNQFDSDNFDIQKEVEKICKISDCIKKDLLRTTLNNVKLFESFEDFEECLNTEVTDLDVIFNDEEIIKVFTHSKSITLENLLDYLYRGIFKKRIPDDFIETTFSEALNRFIFVIEKPLKHKIVRLTVFTRDDGGYQYYIHIAFNL